MQVAARLYRVSIGDKIVETGESIPAEQVNEAEGFEKSRGTLISVYARIIWR